MSEPNLGTSPKQILNEIEVTRRKVDAKPILDYKRVICDEVLPLMQLITEALQLRSKDTRDRLELVEDTVAEYFAGSESRIMPQLADRIVRTLNLGMQLCNHIITQHEASQPFLAEQFRAAGEEVPEGGVPMPPELAGFIQLFQTNAQLVDELVRDVTVAPLEDEDDNDDEDDDGGDAVDKALEDNDA